MTLELTRRQLMHSAGLGALALLSGCAVSNKAQTTAQPQTLEEFIIGMPKAELHVHIEGTVDPTDALRMAARNGSITPYNSTEEFEAALNFTSLESFLKGFHDTIATIRTEEDFYDITYNFLDKCHAQNVLYVDIKFDPQAHLRRGISFETFYTGLSEGRRAAQKEFGISSNFIMCFQRDASLETAQLAFSKALNHQDEIIGIGLDNTEILNFPTKFADIFKRARDAGFKLTSHCDLGQPNSIEHIRACIEDLQVDRLDHGYNILEDDRLVELAVEKELCFTSCPTSAFNTPDPSTRFYFSAVTKATQAMMARGLRVTINTDDPGVMGNRYLNEVMIDAANHLALSKSDVVTLAKNAFEGLWVARTEKEKYIKALNDYAA